MVCVGFVSIRCFVDVFEYKVTPGEAVRIDQDEVRLAQYHGSLMIIRRPTWTVGSVCLCVQVQWGDYMSLEAIQENLEQGQWEWVPDGLQVWDGLVRYWQTRRLRRY